MPLSHGDPTHPRKRVLIAEDHLDSREAMRTLLEAMGYDVLLAANGREAVEIATAEHPDLILMDIMMPVLDGFQAIRSIRSYESAVAGVPIIAVTAMEDAKRLALEAGATDFVAKPVSSRLLLGKIESLLGEPDQDESGD